MEPKRGKYDTNPLDEDVAHRADESFGRNGSGAATDDIAGQTTPINRDPQTARAARESEAPTRRIDDKVTSYPSVFVPPPPRATASYQPPRVPPPNIYQPPPLPISPGLKTVAGLGIQERWALIAPYNPIWLGIVAGFIELLMVPRSEARVRFHAS